MTGKTISEPRVGDGGEFSRTVSESDICVNQDGTTVLDGEAVVSPPKAPQKTA